VNAKYPIISAEEFKKLMEIILADSVYSHSSEKPEYDSTKGHERMDELMCYTLRSLGYGEGVDIFEDSERWYS